MVAPQVDDPKELIDDGFTLVKPKFKTHSVAHNDKEKEELQATKKKKLEENKFAPLFEFASYAAEAKMMANENEEEMIFTENKNEGSKHIGAYEAYPMELFERYEDDEALFYASKEITKMKLGKVKRNKRAQDNKNLKTLRAIVTIYKNARLHGHMKYAKELVHLFKQAQNVQNKNFRQHYCLVPSSSHQPKTTNQYHPTS